LTPGVVSTPALCRVPSRIYSRGWHRQSGSQASPPPEVREWLGPQATFPLHPTSSRCRHA
jgi:hypothetical protein